MRRSTSTCAFGAKCNLSYKDTKPHKTKCYKQIPGRGRELNIIYITNMLFIAPYIHLPSNKINLKKKIRKGYNEQTNNSINYADNCNRTDPFDEYFNFEFDTYSHATVNSTLYIKSTTNHGIQKTQKT